MLIFVLAVLLAGSCACDGVFCVCPAERDDADPGVDPTEAPVSIPCYDPMPLADDVDTVYCDSETGEWVVVIDDGRTEVDAGAHPE